MPLPPPVETLWNDLQSVRADVLKEVEGLSQAQADWRPGDADWSAGEIIHHLMLAEVGTGKLTSKLLKEAGAGAAPCPADLTALRPLPSLVSGGTEAPPATRPERGHPIGQLLTDFKAARERSRQSIERMGAVDFRRLTWTHAAFGEMDLSQWWQLQAWHDADHLQQLRTLKSTPGFPAR
ncbi:MAG: DinB family protein [candidate division NC10 bacterium]|jgi:hypothetical protein